MAIRRLIGDVFLKGVFKMGNDSHGSPLKRSRWKHPTVILVGTLVIGAIGSGLWEVCAKPVVFASARALLDVVTLGSSAVKDSAYASAALDQTAVLSALLYGNSIVIILFASLILVLIREFNVPERLREIVAGRSSPNIAGVSTLEERLNNLESTSRWSNTQIARIRRVRRACLVPMGLTSGYLIASTTIHFQSLQIWRSFHADLRMCAPYLTLEQEELLLSRYSTIKTKSDYSFITNELQAIAESHTLTLHSNSLW